MTEDRIVAKVRALLAKTEEAGATEAEATAAATKAQELMLRYGIELAQIAMARGNQPGVGFEVLDGTKLDPWRRDLAAHIAQSMGGRVVVEREYRKWHGKIEFWGQRDTLPSMVALYQYLEGQLLVLSALAASEVKHANAAQSMRWRRSFLAGVVTRVGYRLRIRRSEIVGDSGGDSSQALVVIKDAVSRAMDGHYGEDGLTKDNTNRSVNAAAYHSGKEAGSRVDLGEGRLQGGATQALPQPNRR